MVDEHAVSLSTLKTSTYWRFRKLHLKFSLYLAAVCTFKACFSSKNEFSASSSGNKASNIDGKTRGDGVV